MVDAVTTTTGVPTVSESASQLPPRYNQLALQVGNTASGALNNLNNLGQNWYQGPRVADFSNLQNQAFGGAGTAAQAFAPNFQAGTSNLGTAAGNIGDVYSQFGTTGVY